MWVITNIAMIPIFSTTGKVNYIREKKTTLSDVTECYGNPVECKNSNGGNDGHLTCSAISTVNFQAKFSAQLWRFLMGPYSFPLEVMGPIRVSRQ